MAEIRVQQVKRRGLGWLWLLIVLALLAVAAWYFLSGTAAPRSAPGDSTTATPATGTSEGPRPAAATTLLLALGDAGDGALRAA